MPEDVTSEKDLSKAANKQSEISFVDYEEAYAIFLSVIAHSVKLPTSSIQGSSFTSIINRWVELYVSHLSIIEKVERIDKRTLGHASVLEKVEADIHYIKEKKADVPTEIKWPSYAIDDFKKIIKNVLSLEGECEDISQILYNIMELEELLGRLEAKARVTERKYEARLAASLRDICRVHEPSEISQEQIKRFAACVRALIEGWGKLNREKVSWIRSRLLEVGLTWLPVTDKAVKDISQMQNKSE